MRIDRLDHLVLTVADVGRTVEFYRRVRGLQAVTFAGGRRCGSAMRRSTCTRPGRKSSPQAARPVPGSADICLISADPLPTVCARLAACGVAIEQGPARGPALPVRSAASTSAIPMATSSRSVTIWQANPPKPEPRSAAEPDVGCGRAPRRVRADESVSDL